MTQQLEFNLPGIGIEPERKAYPPQNEVQMVWDNAHPVTTNQVVAKWLREERALDPVRVNQLDLARVLHADSALPPWAGFSATEHRSARSWFEAGYLMVVPLYDAKGALRSLVARLPRPIKDKREKKSFAALGYGRKGLCFVSGFEQMILQELSASSAPRQLIKDWVFLEGEMNWMTWALQSNGRSVDEMHGFVGMFGGGFDASWAQVIVRTQRPVYLRQDPDEGGHKIANDSGTRLWRAGCRDLFRCCAHTADDNELHRSGVLHPDPTAGAERFVPVDNNGRPISGEAQPLRRSPTPPVAAPMGTAKTTPKSSSSGRRLNRNEREDRLRRAYVRSAIIDGCSQVVSAGAHNHNNELFSQAANCARFMHTQYLDVGFFRDSFSRAGKAVNQSASEIRTTLMSAWDTARRDPARIEWPDLKDLEANAVAQVGEGEGGPSWGDLGVVDADGVWSETDNKEWDDIVGEVNTVEDESQPTLVRTDFTVEELEGISADAEKMAILMGSPRRTVEVTPEIVAMADAALDGIAEHCPDIYTRHNVLCRIVWGLDGHLPVINEVPFDAVVEAASTAVHWVKIKTNRDGDPIETHVLPPPQAMKSLVARPSFPSIRPLNHLSGFATLSPTGELLTAPGYHKQHAVFIAPKDPREDVALYDDQCTPDAARKALAMILDLFQDFQFADEGHRAAAISIIFSLIVRQNFATCPFFAVDASTPGTGKGTVFQVAQAIVTGNPRLSVVQPLNDADEEAKRLLAVALEGRSGLYLFDNIKSGKSLGNAAIDAVLTNGAVMGRVLGSSKTGEAAVRVVMGATGNNITLSGDLQRRTLFIRLIAGDLRGDSRVWAYPNIDQYAAANRLKYLRAALLILRAYKLHGHEPIVAATGEVISKKGMNFSSYGDWCRWCRDPLTWLGMDDPVRATRGSASVVDVGTANFIEFLRATHALLRNMQSKDVSVFRLQQLWEACRIGEHQVDFEFCASLGALGFVDGGRWKSSKVQSILSTYQDRIVDGGLCLVSVTPHRRWEIQPK